MNYARCLRWAASLLLVCTAACHSVGGSAGSDAPVGVLLELGAGLPDLEIAILTRPTLADDSLVQPMASQVRAGALSCRDAVGKQETESALQAGFTLGYRIDGGALAPIAGTDAAPFIACMSRALARAPLSNLERFQSLTVGVRTSTGSSAKNTDRPR